MSIKKPKFRFNNLSHWQDKQIKDPQTLEERDHNKLRMDRAKKRSAVSQVNKEDLIKNNPLYWDVIDKCDEISAQGKGQEIAHTAVGFFMLMFIYQKVFRYGECSLDRQRIYTFAEDQLNKAGVSERKVVNSENVEDMMRLAMEAEHIPSRPRRIEEAEFRDVYYLCLNFISDLDIDLMSCVEIDKIKLKNFIDNYFPEISLYLSFYCKKKIDRVHGDPKVEFFYDELQQCFPDIYQVFRKMRIPEGKWEKARKEKRYQKAYSMVERQFAVKLDAATWKLALNGKNSSALNNLQKRIGDNNPSESIRKSRKKQKDEEAPEKTEAEKMIEKMRQEPSVELESSEGNILYDSNQGTS